MPLEIRDLRALEGPNVYYPVPAVKLQLWADRDIRRALSDAIKQWSQQVGVVIGALDQDVEQQDGGLLITTTWPTPLPNVGELIGAGAVADLQAAESKDEDYSHDDALFAAIKQRKREEPSLAQLQLYAEARVRDLPMLPDGNGKLMFGSGARGFVFDPAVLSLGMPAAIPWDTIGTIPVVAVTGTNGKTTTSRLIAHIVSGSGRHVGRTDTDGIVIDGELVEEGDWAGWGGARRVLTDPRVDVAVLETSRGGILRRGLGFPTCDVSVVTNVSDDHLGELGVTTLEEMARVKGVIVLATRPNGTVVLNADDARVLALRDWAPAPIVLFSRQPDSAAIREHRAAGGGTVVSDGQAIVVAAGDQQGRIELGAVPLTYGGAALHNVENALAATAACLALGLPLATIAAGLGTFVPDAAHNANRLNVFRHGGATAIFDYAHNVAGITALISFAEATRSSGGRLLFVLGGPGDRSDTQIRTIGELVGAAANAVLLHEEERYLRGRQPGEITTLYRAGAEAAGLAPAEIQLFPDELAALEAALRMAGPDDTIVAAAHAERGAMLERLRRWEQGA